MKQNHSFLIATACLLAFLSTVGASLPYPILPPLFAGGVVNGINAFMGLPPKYLFGVALAVNPLGLLIGSAVLGSLSDRYGRRPVMLATTLGAAAGHALTAWSLTIGSYPLFIVARFCTGLLEGNTTVARAMLAEQLRGEQRAHALSWLNGANFMGWFAGPLIAGVTLAMGLTAPFWGAVLALLVGALFVAIALPREPATGAVTAWWQVARDQHAFNLLREPQLRTLFVVQLAYTGGVTAFYEFFPLWLVEVPHFGTRGIAVVSSCLCALMTVSSLFAGRASRHEALGRARLFALATAGAVTVLALGNVWLGVAAIVLFGIPNAFYNAIIPNWSAERFGAHGQGAVMGLIGTAFCISNIVMAICGSLLVLIDTRLILLLGAAMTAWAAYRIQRWRSDMSSSINLQAAST